MMTRFTILTFLIFCSCDKVDSDFRFRYKEAYIEEINTFNGTFWRNYTTGKDSVKFKLTNEEQNLIDSFALAIQINTITDIVDKDSCNGHLTVSFPTIEHELEFSFNDRKRRIFRWRNNNCDDPLIKTVEIFADSLKSMILKKKELKDMRQTDFLIL